MNDVAVTRHQVSRMRRELRQRMLTVTAVQRLTPSMQRITFASPDLHDFESLGSDDHFKLLLPVAPGQGRNGADVALRDYTPRAYDAAKGTMVVDFALHEAGPATAWALAAKVGDQLKTGGPRGSTVVADDFDWYLLIGDETALPAIGRRLEELRPGVPVTTLISVDSDADRQAIQTRADWTALWLCRGGKSPQEDADLFRAALAGRAMPPGEGYIWIAAEAKVARIMREYALTTLKHPMEWVKAAGYWVQGEAGAGHHG